MSLLNTALTGLNASQKHLETIGNNISNANTPGYSRQEVMTSSAQGQYIGTAGYIGSGVNVDSIRRIFDQFLVNQMRVDTQLYNGFQSYRDNIDQVNRLLGDERTGIGPVLTEFFSALQTASDSPGFIPAREALLGTASILQDRFNLINNRLDQQNTVINGQIRGYVGEINNLALGIAQLNEDIQRAQGDVRVGPPNQLFDKRDELVRQLSEIAQVDIVETNGNYDVYIGAGQALVVGFDASRLEVMDGVRDPSRAEVFFVNKNERTPITQAIKGGQLGGTLKFRREHLDEAMNYLGRVAVGVSAAFNQQQSVGITLFGAFGTDLFTDFNDATLARQRVQYNANNPRPNDRLVEVYIRDIGQLTTDDYELRLVGPGNQSYEVVRYSDGQLVKSGVLPGDFPTSIEVEGIEIKLAKGSFQAGDRFTIQPTRRAGSDFELLIKEPAELAFAMPIGASSALGNIGSGVINQGVLLDANTPAFAVPGQLAPPILVVFESPDRYTLLDNTDPQRPKQLQPPMRNLPFTPGVANEIFSNAPGETQVTSYNGWLPTVPTLQRAGAADIWPDNGFNPERIQFNQLDENGNPQLLDRLSFPAGASAAEVSAALNAVPGVTARAFNEVQLSNFRSPSPAHLPNYPMQLFINGVELTVPGEELGSAQNIFKLGYIEDVPNPMTPDFVANRINSSFALEALGITAKSDGKTVTIKSANGDDIRIEMSGDRRSDMPGNLIEGFEVSNGQSVFLTPVSADTRGQLSPNRGFDFSQRGPYSYDFTTPYGDQVSIELTENYATAEEMLEGLAQKIEAQLASQERIKRNDPWLGGLDAPGRVRVQIDELGNISFQVVMLMEGRGNNGSEKMTMGGQIDVIMEEGISMTTQPPYGNLFPGEPKALPTYTGYQFKIDGRPAAGDRFEITYNKDPSADNRNSERMIDLQTAQLLNAKNGGLSFNDAYSQLIQQIGIVTRSAQINTDTAKVSLEQTEQAIQQVSGVNLDEEAARLIRFEQAYNANAQLIKIAQDIFTALLNTLR